MVLLTPDELCILAQLREYGPMVLDELFQANLADSYHEFREPVKRSLDGLVDKGLIDLDKGLYKLHNFSE